MFPLSDSIKADKFPFLNYFLVAATIVIFIVQFISPDPDSFIMKYALIPAHINLTHVQSLLPFVTSIFLHGGIVHILTNMWFLLVFGDNVNDRLSPLGFLLLYVGAGIAGNIAQYLVNPHALIPMLGASGAVAGILGCYFVLFPYAKIKTVIFIIFFITIMEVSAPIMLGYWFILQLFSGAGSLSTITTSAGGVAFFAHIAGFLLGVIVGNMVKSKTELRRVA